jgi:acetyl-CoA carboxylase alpha subunit
LSSLLPLLSSASRRFGPWLKKTDIDASEQIRQLEAKAEELRREIFRQLTPVERLQVARHPRRPTTLDYVQTICDDWFELHGIATARTIRPLSAA